MQPSKHTLLAHKMQHNGLITVRTGNYNQCHYTSTNYSTGLYGAHRSSCLSPLMGGKGRITTSTMRSSEQTDSPAG